jgi:hypothetical protein
MKKIVKMNCSDIELIGFIQNGFNTLEKLRDHTNYKITTIKVKINRLKKLKCLLEDNGIFYLNSDYLPTVSFLLKVKKSDVR